jgi:hypothetical protein
MNKLFIALMITLAGALPGYSADKTITHVVVVWLNDGVNEDGITEVMKKANMLSEIESVRGMKIGRPVASERKIVDGSFTFAISVVFDSDEEMQQYLGDPIHVDFVQSVLTPVLKKIVVYDF